VASAVSNLHMIEGDWVKQGVPAKLPIIPGHEISGTIVELADDVTGLKRGDRVGVQPLWSTCGSCEFLFVGPGGDLHFKSSSPERH